MNYTFKKHKEIAKDNNPTSHTHPADFYIWT